MSKKDPHFQREARKYDNPVASREHLLALFQRLQIPLTFKQVCQELGYQSEEQLIGIKRRLRAMENDGQLMFNKFKQYVLPNKKQILTGKVIAHRDGYGFFVPDADAEGSDKQSKDLFISSFEMQRVIHGDIVSAIASDSKDRKGRKEVRILEIIESRKAPIVGRFFLDKRTNKVKTGIVIPDDARINQEIVVELNNSEITPRHGQIVSVKITQRPTKRRNAIGEIIEVLGDYMAPGMEIEIALREHDLPHQFPPQVLAEVAQLSTEVEESAKQDRVDLRDLPLVTIDGEDARDFDDAVYCQPKKSGGWRLWVAIADVSYYVRPDTALDNEAIARGNSVYFPSQVIPMLPEKLSNGLCSLNPDVDRLCFVCEMTVSAKGKLSGSKFYSAVMRSKARFTYTKVATILDEQDQSDNTQALRAQYQSLVPDLKQLHQMYQALIVARKQRGAIEFETQESIFIFNKARKIERIEAVERNDAHKIIEECMILANVATAKFVEKHQVPALFRVHDKPSADKFANFVSYLAELGVDVSEIDKEDPQPKDYGIILNKIAERPDQELIQTMLLRSMRQAVYQAENIGHFGLALPQYSHFTSPIRRYPDLIVHRIIKGILYQQEQLQNITSKANEGCYSYSPAAVIELGEHCSLTERRADEATRDVADWLKCEFMQDHVGDEFTGVISTVTNFGMFVRLQELHIEGLIHISSLGKDFYQYDEKRLRLVGENTGVKYHVGDLLKVKVAAVNLDEKKIDLVLAGEDALLKKAKPLYKGKKVKPSRDKANSEQPSKFHKNKTRKTKSGKKSTTKKMTAKKSKAKKRPGKNARKKFKSS